MRFVALGEGRLTAVVSTLREHATQDQRELRQALEQRGLRYRSLWAINAIALEADTDTLDWLAGQPEVAEIIWDGAQRRLPEVRPDIAATAKSPSAIEWGVERIRAPEVWAAGFLGQGVLVAGQDTGYQWDHPALKSAYAGWNGTTAVHDYHWWDAIHFGGGSCGANAPAPCDDHNHGTHTMGTLVGDDGGANQIGVAPQARWIGCRNMDQGDGTPSRYAECFQFFLAPTDLSGNNPDPARAPHVINNSWGCTASEGCTDPNILRTLIENVQAAGILVVASAGNSGSACNTVRDPAAIYAASFTVGATTSAEAMSSFSSRGPVTVDGSQRIKPDVVAPGSSIRSSIRNGGYASYSGTSMAGPHVAGAAALLMSADPGLKRDPERVIELLQRSAIPIVSSQECGGIPISVLPNPVFGHGRIDVAAALAWVFQDLFADGFESANGSE
ncbi:S8 family serine peptidase [Xanthomonadaceae bacterium JHOS43]|nr:S8 family serine peptidase [Xanthomonadaceae bacterium JHOS43]MCX7562077.1 S8 family serine peptidase [Xanthomonadaceae bacterium XH05]